MLCLQSACSHLQNPGSDNHVPVLARVRNANRHRSRDVQNGQAGESQLPLQLHTFLVRLLFHRHAHQYLLDPHRRHLHAHRHRPFHYQVLLGLLHPLYAKRPKYENCI